MIDAALVNWPALEPLNANHLKLMHILITRYVDGRSHLAEVALETLLHRFGKSSTSTLSRWLLQMESLEYFTVTRRRGLSNIYELDERFFFAPAQARRVPPRRDTGYPTQAGSKSGAVESQSLHVQPMELEESEGQQVEAKNQVVSRRCAPAAAQPTLPLQAPIRSRQPPPVAGPAAEAEQAKQAKGKLVNRIKTVRRWVQNSPDMTDERWPAVAMLQRATDAAEAWDGRNPKEKFKDLSPEDRRWFDRLSTEEAAAPLDYQTTMFIRQAERPPRTSERRLQQITSKFDDERAAIWARAEARQRRATA
jgi:hypothetical protein